ncbi:MAG: EVE domain-containing protein [Gammaproteobacteria bacterium]|jgi:predicted RNA-binding protein with PUA-like domain|nr:EVE domain-containing protein [Gammaproteobacteria bacterium]
MNYWLMKSEPDVYGINDLKNAAGKTDTWDGVRNYQVRNMMRDDMKKGDLAFFYHSNCKTPGIAGIMKINRVGYPDYTAFDPKEKYFDPKSDPDNPRWYMVDVRFVRKLKRVVTLTELKEQPDLADLPLVRRGNRLSVMPVSKQQWDYILSLE